MSRKLQVKRGKETNLPTLAEGEFGFLTDKKKLYIGSDSGNVKISTGDAGLPVVNITSTDGVAYTGELPELYEGLTIIVIPNRSTNIPSGSLPTLNEVAILPSDLATNKSFLGSDLYPEGFFKSGIPSTITYYKESDDEYIWKTVGVGVYPAKKLTGILPVSKGGTGATTKEEAQANLGIPTKAADIGAATASDLANYLPLTGGTLSGLLRLGSGLAWVNYNKNAKEVNIGVRTTTTSDNDRRYLKITDAGSGVTLPYCLSMGEFVNGVQKMYNIFGEHNTSLLASTIQKLIQNGGLSTLGSAIKVTDAEIRSTKSFSGTGKGRITVSSRYNIEITIDGTIVKQTGTTQSIATTVEFLSSFRVAALNSDSYAYATAVFY